MKPLPLTLLLICLTTPWTLLHADPWGQLFTTPAQRAQLDGGQTASANTDSTSNDATQAAATETIQLTGTLTSSHGKHTVWLNGKPAGRDVRILADGRVELRVSSATGRRLMKSGQLLYPQTGKVVEGYAARPVTPTDHTRPDETDLAQTPVQGP